jgi:hypothetical protein
MKDDYGHKTGSDNMLCTLASALLQSFQLVIRRAGLFHLEYRSGGIFSCRANKRPVVHCFSVGATCWQVCLFADLHQESVTNQCWDKPDGEGFSLLRESKQSATRGLLELLCHGSPTARCAVYAEACSLGR